MWYAMVLGGGSGSRMGMQRNKVLLPVGGESMLCRAVRAFRGLVDGMVVVIRPCDEQEAREQLTQAGLAEGLRFVPGATRGRLPSGMGFALCLRAVTMCLSTTARAAWWTRA